MTPAAHARTLQHGAYSLRRMALALTKQPACARIAETQTWRSNVLLPPMFGPLSSKTRGARPPTVMSLAITVAPSRHGCAPPRMERMMEEAGDAAGERRGDLALHLRVHAATLAGAVLSRASSAGPVHYRVVGARLWKEVQAEAAIAAASASA